MSNGYKLIDPGDVYLKDMNNQVGKNKIVSQFFEYKRIKLMKLYVHIIFCGFFFYKILFHCFFDMFKS
jgi:hypothetical protein